MSVCVIKGYRSFVEVMKKSHNMLDIKWQSSSRSWRAEFFLVRSRPNTDNNTTALTKSRQVPWKCALKMVQTWKPHHFFFLEFTKSFSKNKRHEVLSVGVFPGASNLQLHTKETAISRWYQVWSVSGITKHILSVWTILEPTTKTHIAVDVPNRTRIQSLSGPFVAGRVGNIVWLFDSTTSAVAFCWQCLLLFSFFISACSEYLGRHLWLRNF